MANPLVSIIVPVYNAEEYLCRCLESIISQTYQNIEIILVDDGSKDASGQICDEYAEKDARIRVIHKENGGVAIARQTGLNVAQGKYVIHADSDDWVEPNWIEELLKSALKEKVDIVICDYYNEYQSGSINVSSKPTSLKKEDILSDLLYGSIWGALWNKLIRKDCFERYCVSFIPEMNLQEDLYVICKLIYSGASSFYISIPLYHYDCYSNNSSIVRAPTINQIQSVSFFINDFEKLLTDDIYKEAFNRKKMNLKKRCFKLGKEHLATFVNIYPEINERIIADNRLRWRDVKSFFYDIEKIEGICMAIVLKWHLPLGYMIFVPWKNFVLMLLSFLRKTV